MLLVMKELCITVFAGFLVAFPVTFLAFKKVQVRSKTRYFQVAACLSLSISLFCFLLQTRFAWLVTLTLGFSASFVLVAELMLQRIVSNSIKPKNALSQGPNGSQVSFERARIDSGSYPDDYLTETIWTEMRMFLMERAFQSKPSTIAEQHFANKDGSLVRHLHGFQRYKYVSIAGQNFSVKNGIRTTTNVDETSRTNKIFIFGGSTVFCDEMPDRLTVSSFLQRSINQVSSSYAVVNCGWSGASIIDRTKMLKDLIHLKNGDKAVFYFGDNDSGWTHLTKDGVRLSEDLLPLPIQAMRKLNLDYNIELAGWFFRESSPKWMRKYSDVAYHSTIQALTDAHQYCETQGVEIVVFLQPNLYTLRTKFPSEMQAETRFSNNLRTVILHAYKYYEEWVKETPYAVSATHIFDNAPAPVFLDWAHVNARGNEIIAKFIFEELQRRGMLGSDSKL